MQLEVSQCAQAVLYYACGGGWGHTTRMLSLARQLQRFVPGEHRVVTNSPFAHAMTAAANRWGVGLQIIPDRAPPGLVRAELKQIVESFRPSQLVVDTFPRGVAGELAELMEGDRAWTTLPKVLVSRPLPQAYVDQMGLVAWVKRHYRGVIGCGEPSPLVDACGGSDAGPFLVLSCDELPDRASAAAIGGIDPERPTVLLVGSGTAAEIVEQLPVAERLAQPAWQAGVQFRWAWPESLAVPSKVERGWEGQLVRHYPLLDLLPAVDLVFGSAGYNLSWETRQLSIPARLWAQPRRYDDQRRRSTVELDSHRLSELLEGVRVVTRRLPRSVSYVNGAVVAAEWLARNILPD